MSGSTRGAMIRLLDARDGKLRPMLPTEYDAAGWWQALSDEIATHLTPEHAALLAVPVHDEGGIAWFAPGTALRRFAELDADDRNRLTAAAGAILSDIRRLAESGAAPQVAAAWPALRSVPDLGHLSAVAGRPVLAGWGFAAPAGGAGPLAAFDDGVAWRAAPRLPWSVFGGALAALAALALFVGLVLVPVGAALMPSPAACTVEPQQLALLRDQSREAARGDALKAQLAQLQESRGQRALQCPIPRETVALPPTPQPPPAPPPRRSDLPEERWNNHDLTMLEGCWRRYTNMTVRQVQGPRIYGVREWELCFDNSGHGRQTIVLDSGARCSNDLVAHFNNDNTLEFDEPRRCFFDRREGSMLRAKAICRRETEIEATCDMTDVEGPNAGQFVPGRFRRADAPPVTNSQ